MEKYDELIKSLKNYRDKTEECEPSVLKLTAEAIEKLQTAINEKQKLLDEALNDLAKGCDCKNCANIDACNIRRIERNLAYGGCSKWQWKGAKIADIAS